MKKLIIILLLILIIPPLSATSQDNFNDWCDNYYNPQNDDLKDLSFNSLTKSDFFTLKHIYGEVFSDENSSQIYHRMLNDFEDNDLNKDGKLSYKEFKSFFNPIYQFYKDNPSDYEFFKKVDLNNDSLISLDEFEEISYILIEDSFWDGYPIEEIIQSEFDNVNLDGDDYLNYTEFKQAV